MQQSSEQLPRKNTRMVYEHTKALMEKLEYSKLKRRQAYAD